MSIKTEIKIARLQADSYAYSAAAHEAQAEIYALEGNAALESTYRGLAKQWWGFHESALQRARALEGAA